MLELPAYIQELVCSLAEVTDNDEYIIDVCLRCLEDRNLSDRMLLSLEKGTFVEA